LTNFEGSKVGVAVSKNSRIGYVFHNITYSRVVGYVLINENDAVRSLSRRDRNGLGSL
jgi:hypothetical protein